MGDGKWYHSDGIFSCVENILGAYHVQRHRSSLKRCQVMIQPVLAHGQQCVHLSTV